MTRPIVQEPFDLEVAPGKTVRQLADREECQQALFQLDLAIGSIQSQIAQAEADPSSVEPGWRTRAQSAIRWKKRTRAAIRDFAVRFEPKPTPTATKRKLLLDVIKDELGADEFEQMVAKARQQHPGVFSAGVDE